MIDFLEHEKRNRESVEIFNQFEKTKFQLDNLFDYIKENHLKFNHKQNNFAGISFNMPEEVLLVNANKIHLKKGILYNSIQSFYIFPKTLNSNQFQDLFLNDESHPKLEYISFASYINVCHFYKKFYKLDESKYCSQEKSEFSNYESYVLDHVKDLYVDFNEIKLPIDVRNNFKLNDPIYLLFESDLLRIKKIMKND